ncbi:MAG TPA: lanthionine synthetase LanC family protein [Acidobacteriaceae bacterium]|nr:lanthionine synthetase LanC family protein [Acidobacteriaceae bacterium]
MRIGHRLCRDAVWDGDRCNWCGWTYHRHKGQLLPAFRAQGSSLGYGTAGIGLFLAQLYRRSGDPEHKRAAVGALRQAETRLAAGDLTEPGFYEGVSGILWALEVSGELLSSEPLSQTARHHAQEFAATRPVSPFVSVNRGSAGAIPYLLRQPAATGREVFQDAALAHGEHLLAAATRAAQGWYWRTEGASGLDVFGASDTAGYAYGAGGVGASLLELWANTGDTRFLQAGLRGLEFLQKTLPPKHPQPQQPGPGWSNPPVSALRCLLRAEEVARGELRPGLRDEIRALASAAELTIPSATLFLQPFCLANGAAGTADALLETARLTKQPAFAEAAAAVAEMAFVAIHNERQPWPCAVQGRGESPSLLEGLAGIGYFFLRAGSPASVPSLLTVAGSSVGVRATGEVTA